MGKRRVQPLRHHGAHDRQAQVPPIDMKNCVIEVAAPRVLPGDHALDRDEHRHHHEPHPDAGQQNVHHRGAVVSAADHRENRRNAPVRRPFR